MLPWKEGLSYLEQEGSNVILSAKNYFKDSGCKHINYGAQRKPGLFRLFKASYILDMPGSLRQVDW
jgi:hypothetical protein